MGKSRDLPALFAVGSLFPRTFYNPLKKLGATYKKLKAICEEIDWNTAEKITNKRIKHTVFNQKVGEAYLTRIKVTVQTQEPFKHPVDMLRVNIRTNALAWIQTNNGDTDSWNSIQTTIKDRYSIKQAFKTGCLKEEMDIIQAKFWDIVTKKQTRANEMLDAVTSYKEQLGVKR